MKKLEPLTKKQLREAAKNRTQVRFVINYNSSHYGNIKDIDCLLVPTFMEEKGIEYCNLSNLNGSLAYQLEMGWVTSEESFVYYELDRLISGIYPKDTREIFDRRRERLAAFLHDGVWVPKMEALMHKLSGAINLKQARISGVAWQQQVLNMSIGYNCLSDKEKKSDQELADKLMELLEEE